MSLNQCVERLTARANYAVDFVRTKYLSTGIVRLIDEGEFYIGKLIDIGEYSFILAQTKHRDAPELPKTSSITIRRKGVNLCTITYDCSSHNVSVEHMTTYQIEKDLVEYLGMVLKFVGYQLWLPLVKTKPEHKYSVDDLLREGYLVNDGDSIRPANEPGKDIPSVIYPKPLEKLFRAGRRHW